MGIRKRLQYWFIYHWLLKADMNGYSGLTVYYAFSLPLLSPEVKEFLKANKIKTSEGVRDGKVWRRFSGKEKEGLIISFLLFDYGKVKV